MHIRHTFRPALLFALALVSISGQRSLAQVAQLRSPWDGKTVHLSDFPYTCPTLPAISPDLTTDGFYKLGDPTHSIIDPARQAAYARSSAPVKEVGLAIVTAADAYRTTGSREAARCAIRQIESLTNQGSLTGKMSSNQAYYVQGWVAGAIAIAYLKVREARLVDPADSKRMTQWLEKIGDQTRNYYDSAERSKHGDAGNNHLYWAGFELAAIGVAAQNKSDFDWAVQAYNNGVDQIQPDGTLPLEMARGGRALHYHLYALAPLVLLAEFGEVNDLNLYGHNHGAIHRLVATSIAGLSNPQLFEKNSGVPQEVPHRVSGDQIGWAPPYARRFAPQPVLDRLIKNTSSLSVFYLGGLPPQ